MPGDVDNVALQAGFGFAAYLIAIEMVSALVEQGVLSYERAEGLLAHARANADMHRGGGPSPQMMERASKMIAMASSGLAAKKAQLQTQTPPRKS
jgi:hypothetical protein